MQILPPSCVLPCQADSHSLSLSAAFHLSAGEDVSRLKGQEMLQRAAGMFWLSSHQKNVTKKKEKERKTHFCRGRGAWSVARQVGFQEKRRGGGGSSSRTAGWSQGPCSLMFDESNLAELRLKLSELRTNRGQSRRLSADFQAHRIRLY